MNPVAPIRVTHRRPPCRSRVVAFVVPALVAALTGGALAAGGGWPALAAVAGAGAAAGLGALVLEVDRRGRVRSAAERAALAAAYGREHERYLDRHRAVTRHLVRLLREETEHRRWERAVAEARLADTVDGLVVWERRSRPAVPARRSA